MSWHLECRENSEAIKQPVVYIDITKKKSWNNIHLKTLITFQHFVKLPISFYNGRMEEFLLLVFNYVVYIDYYERLLCWQFHNFYKHDCVLSYYVCTWCNQMQCSQMCVSFLSRSFPTLIESILGKIQMITPHQIIFI